MPDLTASSPTARTKRFGFRIRLEPRLEEPPRWYPALVSLGAIILALVIGGIVIDSIFGYFDRTIRRRDGLIDAATE